MFHTFSYDGKNHEIVIAFKLWSDFGAHIPLIRSFSMGDNLSHLFNRTAVQYPVFAGPAIRYHFLFDMAVGLLEKAGMRIDWALNIPSIIGFFFLLVLLYTLANRLFNNKYVGVLTVVFFLFNGSLSFLRFFMTHPLSVHTIQDIAAVRDFPAFAPWGPGEITAFWNLNIYTNQRQLAPAFAIILLFMVSVVTMKRLPSAKQFMTGVLWGVIFGIFPYFHQPSLLIIAIVLLCYFLLYPDLWVFMITTGITSALLIIPQVLAIPSEAHAATWYPGFTIHNELLAQNNIPAEFWHMLTFWWQNMGLHSVLIVTGFFLIPSKARRAILPIIPLFLVANLFKFSVEASANHKLFNFVFIVGQMISAYLIVRLFTVIKHINRHWIIGLLDYLLIGLLVLTLTLSGVIDFFVIANDTQGRISDIPANEVATWIAKNTPKNAIFLNSSYLYHPASLAGRSIFLGWPYFAWSAGYPENRMPIMDTMYETDNTAEVCALLHKYNISYITVEDVTNDVNLPVINLNDYLKKYTPVFTSKNGRYAIFTTLSRCSLPAHLR